MAKLIRCECGFVARGESDDQVVGVIRGHMASDHPALLATVSREDLLSWVQAESLRLACQPAWPCGPPAGGVRRDRLRALDGGIGGSAPLGP